MSSHHWGKVGVRGSSKSIDQRIAELKKHHQEHDQNTRDKTKTKLEQLNDVEIKIKDRIAKIEASLAKEFKHDDDFENDEKLKDITLQTIAINKVKDIVTKIENIKAHQESINNLTKEFKISKKSHLLTNATMKQDHSYFDDKLNSYFTPLITTDPILSIDLNLPFNQWNKAKQNEFLYDLANELDIHPSELVPICAKNGSTKLAILLCNLIEEQFPLISKKIVTLTEKAKEKTSQYCSKWQLKKSSMESFFKRKFQSKKKKVSANVKQQLNTQMPSIQKSGHQSAVSSNWSSNASSSNSSSSALALAQTAQTDTDANKELNATEKWFLEQGRKLRKILTKSLQHCSFEYEILSVVVLDNDKCVKNFIQTANFKESKLLYHGTKLKYLSAIYEGGFSDDHIGSSTDAGWYGRGHYFSSLPQYCMPYCEANEFGQSTLIVSHVNCGKIKNIYENYTFRGKNIENGIDSHYVHVNEYGKAISQNNISNYTFGIDMFDEYVIKSGKYILPKFCVTFRKKHKLLIWRDPKVYNYENRFILGKLEKCGYTVYAAKSTQDALMVLERKKTQEKNKVFIITNGADNSEDFINKVRNDYKCDENILVFTSTLAFKKQYCKFANVQVTVDPNEVYQFVNKHLGDNSNRKSDPDSNNSNNNNSSNNNNNNDDVKTSDTSIVVDKKIMNMKQLLDAPEAWSSTEIAPNPDSNGKFLCQHYGCGALMDNKWDYFDHVWNVCLKNPSAQE